MIQIDMFQILKEIEKEEIKKASDNTNAKILTNIKNLYPKNKIIFKGERNDS